MFWCFIILTVKNSFAQIQLGFLLLRLVTLHLILSEDVTQEISQS